MNWVEQINSKPREIVIKQEAESMSDIYYRVEIKYWKGYGKKREAVISFSDLDAILKVINQPKKWTIKDAIKRFLHF